MTADPGSVAAAEALAAALWQDAEHRRGRRERARAARTARLLASPSGRELILALTDEVLRIRSPARAARVLAELAGTPADGSEPALGPFDRLALRAGAAVGPYLPGVVVPAARTRVRAEMGSVILPAGPHRLGRHIARRRAQGIWLNVNVLGEAILGEDEAERRMARVREVLAHPAVDYVSVKISSVCSQLDVVRFDHEVERIAARLRRLYDQARSYRPPKFVNLDMEEYRDLELTLAVFRQVLDEDAYAGMGAGIVLQAYLPDSLPALIELCDWARERHRRAGGWIKVRIVKGANLAMERVDAELHGWPQAPFATKAETDAHYKRLLDVALDPANDGAVRVGVASHNVFELAWAATIAGERGASGRVEFEMLEGMAPAVAEAAASRLEGLLLYAPIVESGEIETAIAYLVRRLDENGAPENFLAHQFTLRTGSADWNREADRWRRSVADRHTSPATTRRTQDRAAERGRAATGEGFANEPDTDFSIAANRRWALDHLAGVAERGLPEYRPVIEGRSTPAPAVGRGIDPGRPDREAYRWCPADRAMVEAAVATARAAQGDWAGWGPARRRAVLHGVADALARERGRLLAVMAVDTGKTLREGDPEVSEAIDFATYYADHAPADDSGFRPHGTVVVASPWNFPLSIPAGGVLGALAAGNSVILKPAPEAVAVAGELARVVLEGGVPPGVFHFLPCEDGAASQRLITHPDVNSVILTGSWDTARRFLQWRPELRLHAETSGKNAIVITATADLDEAIADLVHSAFGHAGQKCSAASLAIVEAAVHDDPRFLRRLADAVSSLRPGPGWDPVTSMGPVIRPPEGPLLDALTRLQPGERWLVTPQPLEPDRYLWSPGVKVGVAPGSPFHLTECFGPVLGVMRAADLDQATTWQNQTPYGLTAGLHALDPAEIERWRENVEAGNLYVNRGTTGAIVRRQPFGGWRRSVVGPGAKAGGPNYVASLGTWPAAGGGRCGEAELERYRSSCRQAWDAMARPVDLSGLAAESNVFRYRPLRSVVLCCGPGAGESEARLAGAAAGAVGVSVQNLAPGDLRARVATLTADKVRLLGSVDDATRLAAFDAGLWVDDIPVAADAGREVLRWAREQAVSESRHRHGNVTGRRPGLAGWPPGGARGR